MLKEAPFAALLALCGCGHPTYVGFLEEHDSLVLSGKTAQIWGVSEGTQENTSKNAERVSIEGSNERDALSFDPSDFWTDCPTIWIGSKETPCDFTESGRGTTGLPYDEVSSATFRLIEVKETPYDLTLLFEIHSAFVDEVGNEELAAYADEDRLSFHGNPE